jgi:prepilin-type N-terminal cleavage/methylation domain-containing protein
MTSTARKCKGSPAFTLLEMVMVLTISALVLAGAVGLMAFSSEEQKLRDASSQLEVLAKRARAAAMLNQTPYAVEFREGVARLMLLAEVGRDENYTVGGNRIGGKKVEEEGEGVLADVKFAEDIEIYVRRWNSEKWLPMEKKSIHVWRFDPNGLCEPISLRYVMEKTWMENTYNPLTAAIRYSELDAR